MPSIGILVLALAVFLISLDPAWTVRKAPYVIKILGQQ